MRTEHVVVYDADDQIVRVNHRVGVAVRSGIERFRKGHNKLRQSKFNI